VWRTLRRWFRRVFGGPAAPAPRRAGTGAAAPPGVTRVQAPPAGHEAYAELWALVSGDAKPDAAPRSPLGEQVLDYYRRHRPDPASFPAMAVRIVDLLERPEVRVDELARWVGMDPAIAGQVLKVANSVIYRRGQDVDELPEAIVRLGLREVGQIAVGVAGRSLFDLEVRAEIETFRERLAGQFLDAMTVAYGASWLAGQLHLGRPEKAFLAGMLHDIGFPVALQSLARLVMAGEVRDQLEPPQIDALLADVHLEVGSDVSAAWCLPPYLLAACAHHHDPHLPTDADHAELHLVRVVSGLQCLRRTGLARGLVETRDSLKSLGMDRPATEGLLRQLEAAQQRVSTLFA
jgi:HD-like signal output (HDOD) protein